MGLSASKVTHVRQQSVASGIVLAGAAYLGFDYNVGQALLLGLIMAISTEIGDRLAYDLVRGGNQTEMNMKKAFSSALIATVINYIYPVFPSSNQAFNFLLALGAVLGGESLMEILDGHSSSATRVYTSTYTGGQGAVI